ncbi:MAG: flagellin, partial [Burkholderiaceae bacterium]|nr:flagellin [Burkholderiaceae bacterium]
TSVDASVATDTVTFTNSKLGAQSTFGGYSESVTGGGGAGALVQTSSGTGTAAADGTGVTTYGKLKLSSASSFTLGGTALAAVGLSGASVSLTQLSSVDISTVSGSNDAIATIDGALSQISSMRASLGAYQNRFDSVVNSLSTSAENLTNARSRILDADYASETASLTRAQILQQAGTAMLAQANSVPNTVLTLLKG